MEYYVEGFRQILNSKINEIELNSDTQIPVVNELYDYLSAIIGSELNTEDENCLHDIALTVIAQSAGQIPQNKALLISSEKVLQRSDFFRRAFKLKLMSIDKYISKYLK